MSRAESRGVRALEGVIPGVRGSVQGTSPPRRGKKIPLDRPSEEAHFINLICWNLTRRSPKSPWHKQLICKCLEDGIFCVLLNFLCFAEPGGVSKRMQKTRHTRPKSRAGVSVPLPHLPPLLFHFLPFPRKCFPFLGPRMDRQLNYLPIYTLRTKRLLTV